MKRSLTALAILFAAAAGAALAQATEGEVLKVDKAQQRITLKHGAIKNLEMPAMQMVFRVRDASLLDKVQAGDKVRFSAERIDGQYTVTSLQPR